MLGRRRHFIKRAIHAITNSKFSFERLEMNIARAALHSLHQDEINKPNDRSFVREADHHVCVLARGDLIHFAGDFLVRPEFAKDVRNALAFLRVVFFDQLLDLCRISHDKLKALLHDEAKLIELSGIERIHKRDLQRSVIEENRQALIHTRRIGGDRLDDLRRYLRITQRNDARAEMIRHDLQHRIEVHDAEILKYLDYRLSVRLNSAWTSSYCKSSIKLFSLISESNGLT